MRRSQLSKERAETLDQRIARRAALFHAHSPHGDPTQATERLAATERKLALHWIANLVYELLEVGCGVQLAIRSKRAELLITKNHREYAFATATVTELRDQLEAAESRGEI